jgi:DNA polymerase
MGKFFPGQSISRIHGTFKQAGGRFVVPMYHPAAALHQGNLKSVILNDFRSLPAILERARRMRSREREEAHAEPPPAATLTTPATPAEEPQSPALTRQFRLFD